ncbi:MAG: hypothetical protein P1U77_13035 [Rubripirellula sp.]|jgi:hypothetical protein|nr:hypothetical protein [Planctomycetaceae bacterium]MDF1842355.1 hypothetical protein [Rubripirellula sp.]
MKWIMLSIGFFLCWSSAMAAPGDYDIKVGQYHPDLTLPSIESGKPISLRQFRGKKTLLIHFASW